MDTRYQLTWLLNGSQIGYITQHSMSELDTDIRKVLKHINNTLDDVDLVCITIEITTLPQPADSPTPSQSPELT